MRVSLARHSGAERGVFLPSFPCDMFSILYFAAISQEQKHLIHMVKGWCVHAGFFFGRCIDSWEEEQRGGRTKTRFDEMAR